MTVISTILKEKGGHIEAVTAEATIAEAARRLASKRIGALVVVDGDGKLAGIVSERDLVRALSSHGGRCLEMKVRDVMTAEVITCKPSDTVDNLMEVMTSGRFRHVPVMEGDRLVGVVSIGDIVKYKIAEATAEAEALRSYIVAG